MFRHVVLAVAFCSVLWATAAQAVSESSEAIVAVAGADACPPPSADGRSTGDPHDQWDAHHHTNASITESLWKFPLVHADLAGARSPDGFVAIRTAGVPDRRPRPSPDHLLRIPLLI